MSFEFDTAKFLNPAYLSMVRKVPCLACRLQNNDYRGETEAHHEALSYRFQFTKRSSDYTALPLCRKHHWERHNLGGMETFWYRFNPNIYVPYYMCINLISVFAGNNNINLTKRLLNITNNNKYYDYGEVELRKLVDELFTHVHTKYFSSQREAHAA